MMQKIIKMEGLIKLYKKDCKTVLIFKKVHTIVHVLLGICCILIEHLFFTNAMTERLCFVINIMRFFNSLFL